MSSGFVSGGTTDAPIERGDEWLAAQQELEAIRRRKAEESRQADGKTLFETLQANKAAKEEAFQEAHKLKNQFRALDEDEIEFLDSVLESTRAEEARVKRETAEGLEAFRRQQDEADKKLKRESAGADADAAPIEEEAWVSAARKRKRAKEKEVLKGVKVRKSSSRAERSLAELGTVAGATPDAASTRSSPTEAARSAQLSSEAGETVSASKKSVPEPAAPFPMKKTNLIANLPKGGLGLVDYGSDSDE